MLGHEPQIGPEENILEIVFDRENTVSHMDRWTSYLVDLKATPLLLIARTDDGLVTCLPEGIREMPFLEAMELMVGWASPEAVDEL